MLYKRFYEQKKKIIAGHEQKRLVLEIS
jgi:hypothetical protein